MRNFSFEQLEYAGDFILQFIPALIILTLLIFRTRSKKPVSSVLIAFCLGISIHYPLDLLIFLAEVFLNYFIQDGNTARFYLALFRSAYLEEGLKFIIIYYFCLRHEEYKKPSETFIYAIAVALGFSVYENLEYYKIFHMGIYQRYVVTFAHIGFAMLMSIFLSISMFNAIKIVYQKKYIKGCVGLFCPVIYKHEVEEDKFIFSKKLSIFLALALPVAFHALWNGLLMFQLFDYHKLVIYINFLFVFVMAFYLWRAEKKEIIETSHKREDIKNINIILNFIYVWIVIALIIFLVYLN